MTVHKLKNDDRQVFPITWCGLKVHQVDRDDSWTTIADDTTCKQCLQAFEHYLNN